MARALTKKQQKVLEALFSGQADEPAVLKKHNIPAREYRNWLCDPRFVAELEFRISAARRQSRILLARYAAVAAVRLVALTEGDKEETARKACLDILALQGEPTLVPRRPGDRSKAPGHAPDGVAEPSPIPPDVANKMLELLAESGANEPG